MTTTSTDQIKWGFPNFGAATKAHAFAGPKSLCGKYERESVLVLTADTGERHPHVDCARCAERIKR